MIDPKQAFIFIKDYSNMGGDRFFLISEERIVEIAVDALIVVPGEVVCHDYWLIAPTIFSQTKSLPQFITDVEELRISTSGMKADRESRDKIDIFLSLKEFANLDLLNEYRKIFNRKIGVNIDVLREIGKALIKLSDAIESKAKNVGEWIRYLEIDRPVSNYLIGSAAKGIAIDEAALRRHKKRIEFEYFMALKEFSSRYSMPLELPSDEDVVEYLLPKGYDFSGVTVDYVLNFVPMSDGFAEELLKLRRISVSRRVLDAIPISQRRIYPIVDAFGSITSRIYYKDPSLQSLSKRHRDIITSDVGMVLSYIDYDQYEAGIMAALSRDKLLLDLYAFGDLYVFAAEVIFNDRGRRKEAKRLFLSYAYGMKRQNLIDAACKYGADRKAAKSFFDQFKVFEKWKLSLYEEFEKEGRIGTVMGNYLCRNQAGNLTDKEKRSAVSQVVQGTASLIFKKALLKISLIKDIHIMIPMHDAILFQHPVGYDTSILLEIFSGVMSKHFEKVIEGKASIARFF